MRLKFLLAAILLLATVANAAAAVFSAESVYQLLYRIDGGQLYQEQTVFKPSVEQGLGRFGSFSGALSLTAYGLTGQLSQTADEPSLQIEIERLRVDLFNAPLSGTELRIGYQHLSVGKSDFFRHLDVVNPPDLRDPLAFERRSAVPMIHFKWMTGMDSEWSFFAQPAPALALYPHNSSATAGWLQQLQTAWNGVTAWQEQTALPQPGLDRISGGTRFNFRIGRSDFTLLAVRRFLPWLLAQSLSINSDQATVEYTAVQEWVFGGGAVSDLGGLGLRMEFAAHHSGAVSLTTLSNGTALSKETVVRQGWYWKGMIGLEYRFAGNGPFVKFEISRGFIGDWNNGSDHPFHWYGIVTVEQQLLQATLTVSLSGGVEWIDPQRRLDSRNSTWFAAPSINFQAGNHTRLELSGFVLGGADGSLLGSMGVTDLLAFKCTVRI